VKDAATDCGRPSSAATAWPLDAPCHLDTWHDCPRAHRTITQVNSEERRKKARQNRFECAYCGKPRETMDHVPPRGIYGDVVPHGVNLVTVPSCGPCNNGCSADDTYFRDFLFMTCGKELGDVPNQILRPPVARSVVHAGKKHRTPIMEITKGGRPIWGYSSSGKTLIPATAVFFDWAAVHRVLIRTTRGLYWKHWKQRVPSTHHVTVVGDTESRNDWSTQDRERFSEDVLNAPSCQRVDVHPSTFSYSFNIWPQDQSVATFLLVFFRRAHFLLTVCPQMTDARIIDPTTPTLILTRSQNQLAPMGPPGGGPNQKRKRS
jgi:hypothetical protein